MWEWRFNNFRLPHDIARPFEQRAMENNLSAKFSDHRYSGSGNMILVCQVNLQGYMIKGSCDLMVDTPLYNMYDQQIWQGVDVQ